MKRKLYLFSIFLIGLLFCLILPIRAYAASDVYVDPSSGTYTDDFSVELSINTNGDAINGVDVDLDYTGAVDYVSTTSGNIGCTPSVDEVEVGSLSIICFIAPGSEFNGDGVIGTIFFSPTGSGSVTVEPSYVDIAGSTVGSYTGGSYTVSQAVTTTTTSTTSTSTTSTLQPSSTTTSSTTIVLEPTTTTVLSTTTTLANSTTTSVYTPTTVLTTTTAGSSSSTLPDTARLNFSNPVVWFSVLSIVGCILFGVNLNGSSRIKKSKSSSSTESMRSKI